MDLKKDAIVSTFADMSVKNIPELGYLLTEIEKKYGRRVATSTDFECLAADIQDKTKSIISASTLKRMWGYVTLCPQPRIATLDTLSRYLGFASFSAFCEDLAKRNIVESGFFTTRSVAVSDLNTGDRVLIGWAPDRLVALNYLGNFSFEVVESHNSKLMPGDRFELSSIIVGYPLYIARILRGGEYTPSYAAGKNGGINILKVN